VRPIVFAAVLAAVAAAGAAAEGARVPGAATPAPLPADSLAPALTSTTADSLAAVLTPDEVAQRVDEHAYYPQEHGIEALRAHVRVPQLDTLFAAHDLPTPDIEFVWRAPDARSFVVGASKAQELRARVIRLLQGRGELIVPKPLAQTLARYETRAVEARGDTLILTASTADTTVEPQSLRFSIEPHAWRLLRMDASTSRGPLVQDNEFRQADDLNVLSSMRVRFSDVSARVNLDYAQSHGYWFVTRVSYSVRGGSVGMHANGFEILLDNFRVNADARDR
jgi:hypothetical protein